MSMSHTRCSHDSQESKLTVLETILMRNVVDDLCAIATTLKHAAIFVQNHSNVIKTDYVTKK